MKKYILYILSVLILMAGCDTKTNTVSTGNDSTGSSHTNTQKVSVEIPLGSHRAKAFAYNPAENTLTLFERKHNTYYACQLQADNTWATARSCWTVKKDFVLDNFTYSPDGLLYACKKRYHTKGHLIRQSFVRLTGHGKIQSVPMKKLNQTPKAAPNTSSPKKNGIAEVLDIKFSGTALAFTYKNHAVKFYNIAEGQALGSAGIHGEAGLNAFYNCHYICAASDSNTRKNTLGNYDIRSGDLAHSITFAGDKNRTMPYFLKNYRDKLYLLCEDGLFCGTYTGNSLQKRTDLSFPDISSAPRLKYFEAARDDILYIVYQDDNANLHLYRLSVS